MDMKHLRYFLQVCKDKSFTTASKNLFITQQGLSKAINKIEESLQLPLFIRSRNGVELTENGYFLYENALPLMQEYDLLIQKLDEMANKSQTSLRIGFSHGILNALSPEFMQNFRDKHETIELVISEHSDIQCEQLIANNELDIAFMIGPIDEEQFKGISIKKEPMCALINEKNPLSKLEELDFKDLLGERIAIINKEFHTYYNFTNKCLEAGFTPNITSPVAEIMTVHRLSKNNKCVGISAIFVVNEIGAPDSKVIPFKDPSFVWEIFLITNKNINYNNAKKSFIKYTMDYTT